MEETLSQCTMASKHPSIIQSHIRAEIILKGNLLFDCLNDKVDRSKVVSVNFDTFEGNQLSFFSKWLFLINSW